jgi:hypothetical protein
MTAQSIPDLLMDNHQYALLDSRQYDRQPDLNRLAREALIQAMVFCTGNNETRLPQQLNSALTRLLQPCKDILACLELPRSIAQFPYKRSCKKWMLVLPPTGAGPRTYGPRFSPPPLPAFVALTPLKRDLRVRFHLMVIAYVVGPPTDFFLPLLGDISPLALAGHLFGKIVLQRNVDQMCEVLSGWGYGYEDTSNQRCLATTEAPVMLVNRSASLDQVTFALLVRLRQKMKPYQRGTDDASFKGVGSSGDH